MVGVVAEWDVLVDQYEDRGAPADQRGECYVAEINVGRIREEDKISEAEEQLK